MQRGEDLVARVREIVAAEAPSGTVEAIISGEAFLSQPGPLIAALVEAVQAETGLVPELSTTGGTSDARFLSKLCLTAEFGLVNATMHKTDEAVAVDDLHALTRIYAAVIARMLPLPTSMPTSTPASAHAAIHSSNADPGIGSASTCP